jgi:nitrite reductase/ring-hydroxylating ferredoxin subunit
MAAQLDWVPSARPVTPSSQHTPRTAGKTAFFQGTITPDKCVVCPAHNTAFDLATGAVKGTWCPKVRGPGSVVGPDKAGGGFCLSGPHTMYGSHPVSPHAQFPDLPLVGKMTAEKPLPTYQSRVDEAGNIEVLV